MHIGHIQYCVFVDSFIFIKNTVQVHVYIYTTYMLVLKRNKVCFSSTNQIVHASGEFSQLE